MSLTVKAGAAAAGGGAAGGALGVYINANWTGWVLIGAMVLLSVAGGAWAALGHYEANLAISEQEKRANRVRARSVLLAQVMGGAAIAIKAQGDPATIILSCLVIGWVGAGFLKWLSDKAGISKDDD